jgi:cell division protease FtsH
LNRFFRSALFPLIILVVLAWVAMNTLTGDNKQAEKATYSDLVTRVQDNPESIEQVTVNPRKQEITAELTGGDSRKIVVNYPTDESYAFFERQLRAEGVKYDSKGVGGNWWGSILVSLLPFVILIAFWIFLMNQVQGGGSKVMSFGKSRAKRMTPDSPKIGFKDVAGVDEAVEELHEIKEFLENPKKFQALGARIPKGVLLYGPPGTGKTLLARAVAG